jgi:hypothetical protein
VVEANRRLLVVKVDEDAKAVEKLPEVEEVTAAAATPVQNAVRMRGNFVTVEVLLRGKATRLTQR